MDPQDGLTTDDMREQIATLRADLTTLSETLAEGVKDRVGDAGREVARSSREAWHGVIDAVTRNPLTAICLAAGVGYLLGTVARR